MLFFMRLRAFALASSTSSVLLLHYLCSRALFYFAFAKINFTAAITFLRENYAKLLRVVQWINFV